MAPTILTRIRSAERTAWLFAAACAVGASAIIIAMPMYHDHAIYWRGGERLLLGRPLADDYLVKQPAIYAIFAFSRAIFGEHEWSYRVVDAALQLFLRSVAGTGCLPQRWAFVGSSSVRAVPGDLQW